MSSESQVTSLCRELQFSHIEDSGIQISEVLFNHLWSVVLNHTFFKQELLLFLWVAIGDVRRPSGL